MAACVEPLSGYLLIGQKLLQEEVEFGDAWNFGPSDEHSITVHEVITNVAKHWDKIDSEINKDNKKSHEANLLKSLIVQVFNKVLNWRFRLAIHI